MKIDSVDQLTKYRKELSKQKSKEKTIYVCAGTGCRAKGGFDIFKSLEAAVANDKKLSKSIDVKATGCHGFCEKGPLVVISPEDIFYIGVTEENVNDVFEKTIKNGEIIESLLFRDPETKKRIKEHGKINFYSKQHRLVLKNIGRVDPISFDEYMQNDGLLALEKIFSAKDGMTPEAVISTMKESALRGRGGGGFLVGRKWESAKKVSSDIRYILCNGDEGDPGAFMDRSIMEGDPYAVLEGMIIAAYAVGATEGYIYVREEYPLAVDNLKEAIKVANQVGMLGNNIFGSDFSFKIKISQGAGAFVCGESSALMLSVAGNVGEPRPKYIHSTEKGLYDKPSVLNNVETFVNVPLIIAKGADWFKSIGVEKNYGTKVFSLVGQVQNTGLVEVPMGTSLKEIIFDIGGGMLKGRPFKAVQTGGPSGGCLPEAKLDTSIDFDSLTKEGSMMGSGGMIVMNDRSCMVDVARYFLKFLVEESCGKCVPCREGVYQMYRIVEGICQGRGNMNDLKTLEKLSKTIVTTSLCALGKSAPNPVLSTLHYFMDEYKEHIEQKKCSAGVCKELINFSINDKCTGCTACKKACPTEAITGDKKEKHLIDVDKCIKCGECRNTCRFEAIDV